MSVIIRLQNLPWSANALDIRQYFRGLSIPEGGVHIVGGELGDAFIAFSTDEDARQAFHLNNGKIKEIQIKLLLSSRTEMQKVIEAARTAPFMQSVVPQPAAIPSPAIIPQAPLINQPLVPTQDLTKKDDDSKSSKDDSKRRSSRDRDRDRGRRRSRSRSRSRDRKDRSRDRRDRRRRDRTRSRDRRDRRDRDRRRRSRSRDRTRSRDRDSRRSREDNKKDNRDSKVTDVIEIKDDVPNPSRVWEKKNDMPNEVKVPPTGLLGNYPGGPTTLEDARRSLGLLTGLQQNNMQAGPMNTMNSRMPRNDMNNQNRDNNWPRKNRFGDNEMGMINQFNQPGNMPIRPSMNPNMNMGGLGSNMFPNQPSMRLPMQQQIQQENFGMNRPFLARPGTTFPDQFGRPDPRNQQFSVKIERSDESFRNDRNRMNCCVQLRPYFGGYGEVRKFFNGLYISNTGVKFVTENGKRTGIVYIKFVRPDGKEQALSRSGMVLRGVPVEVAHLDDEEWEHYGVDDHQKNDDNNDNRTEENLTPHLQHFTCVVVEDLSEFAKEHDILKLFSDYAIVSVHMIVNKLYRQQAFVQFSKEDDAKNAIADKTSHVISGKPVTVRPVSDETFNEVVRQQTNGENVIDVNYSQNDNHSPAHDNFQPNIPSHIITDCVMLNGLPHKTTDRDVLDFFSDIGIVPVRIHIMLNKFGPTGECFCEFNNPDEAVCALDKNDMPLGTGTVRVELCHRRDMERALGMPPSPGGMNQGPGPRFPNRFGPRPNLLGPRPPPNMMRRRLPGPGMRYDGPVETMGPQGCVVAMENVPFKAGVDEILDFFANFELSTHNVFRRFNDNGAPTGDARVTFNNPTEAHRAVEECNKLKIRDRPIYLRIL